jgi:hypothetical protein
MQRTYKKDILVLDVGVLILLHLPILSTQNIIQAAGG